MINTLKSKVVLAVLTMTLVTSCATPETQVDKSMQTGAGLGVVASVLLGGDTEDIVNAALVGGYGGAVVGGMKAHEQEAKKSNEIAEQDSKQRMVIEQEHIALEKQKLEATKQATGLGYVQSTTKVSNSSYVDNSWLADPELLSRAYGQDSVDGLFALRNCNISAANVYAAAAQNSKDISTKVASTWLKALIAIDEKNTTKQEEAFNQLVELDSTVNTTKQASELAHDAMIDIRADRESLGVTCK